jgi:uncharacterized protein YukE
MARTTISIPDALKARMDELDGWNWSGVAQAAFQKIVDRETAKAESLAEALEGDEMNMVINRLRKSREEYEEWRLEQLSRDAFNAGVDWAKNRADYLQLASLAEMVEVTDMDTAAQARGLALVGHGMTVDEAFYAREQAQVPPLQFWGFEIGLSDSLMELVKLDEATFGPHFFEGALSVWQKVADEI